MLFQAIPFRILSKVRLRGTQKPEKTAVVDQEHKNGHAHVPKSFGLAFAAGTTFNLGLTIAWRILRASWSTASASNMRRFKLKPAKVSAALPRRV